MDIAKLKSALGEPTSLESDPRAGVGAVWGSRATGAFAVSRGAISDRYEVVLIPSSQSGRQAEKHHFTTDELNTFFEANLRLIQDTLSGR